jgi:hypothetical protein
VVCVSFWAAKWSALVGGKKEGRGLRKDFGARGCVQCVRISRSHTINNRNFSSVPVEQISDWIRVAEKIYGAKRRTTSVSRYSLHHLFHMSHHLGMRILTGCTLGLFLLVLVNSVSGKSRRSAFLASTWRLPHSFYNSHPYPLVLSTTEGISRI